MCLCLLQLIKDIPRPDLTDDETILPADQVNPIELTITSTKSSPHETKRSFKKAKYSGSSSADWMYSGSSGNSELDADMVAAMRNGQLHLPVDSEQLMEIARRADSGSSAGHLFGRADVSPYALRTAARLYHSEFARFKLLEQFFDGEEAVYCWK